MAQEKLGQALPNMFDDLGPLLLFCLFGFLEIFKWNTQHSKTLPFLFALILVVNFVCFSQCSEIPIIGVVKPFESPVNEHIMNQKVGNAVKQDAKANGDTPNIGIHHSQHDAQPTWNGVNQKENIIALKHFLMRDVVVLMKVPHETMHHKSMRGPGHELHDEKSGQCD